MFLSNLGGPATNPFDSAQSWGLLDNQSQFDSLPTSSIREYAIPNISPMANISPITEVQRQLNPFDISELRTAAGSGSPAANYLLAGNTSGNPFDLAEATGQLVDRQVGISASDLTTIENILGRQAENGADLMDMVTEVETALDKGDYNSLVKSGDLGAANETAGSDLPYEMADSHESRAELLGVVNDIKDKVQLADYMGVDLKVTDEPLQFDANSWGGDTLYSIPEGNWDTYLEAMGEGVAPDLGNTVTLDPSAKNNFYADLLTKNDSWGKYGNPSASAYFGGTLDPNSLQGQLFDLEGNPATEGSAELLGQDGLWFRDSPSKYLGKVNQYTSPQAYGGVGQGNYNYRDTTGWADTGNNAIGKYDQFVDHIDINSPFSNQVGTPKGAQVAGSWLNRAGRAATTPFRWLGKGAEQVLDTAGDLVEWVPGIGPRVDKALDSLGGGIAGMGNSINRFGGRIGNSLIKDPAQLIKSGFQGLTGNFDAAKENARQGGAGVLDTLTNLAGVGVNAAGGVTGALGHLLKDFQINIGGSASGGGGGGGGSKKKSSKQTSTGGSKRPVGLDRGSPGYGTGGIGGNPMILNSGQGSGKYNGGTATRTSNGYDLTSPTGRSSFSDEFGQQALAHELSLRPGISVSEGQGISSASDRDTTAKGEKWFTDLKKTVIPGYHGAGEKKDTMKLALDEVLEERLSEGNLIDAFKDPGLLFA